MTSGLGNKPKRIKIRDASHTMFLEGILAMFVASIRGPMEGGFDDAALLFCRAPGRFKTLLRGGVGSWQLSALGLHALQLALQLGRPDSKRAFIHTPVSSTK